MPKIKPTTPNAATAKQVAPSERASECLDALEAAGMGQPGNPHGNTLTGMVNEICEKYREREDVTLWIEEMLLTSGSHGVSFDKIPPCEGEPGGFRFMKKFFIGPTGNSIRNAIQLAKLTIEQSKPFAVREKK